MGGEIHAKPCEHHADLLRKIAGLCNNANQLAHVANASGTASTESLQKIAGGEYLFKSHDYRHTVATEYYESGVSIQAVRDYLGHDHEDMTRQYIDYMPKRLDDANEDFFSQQEENLAAGLMKGEKDGE